MHIYEDESVSMGIFLLPLGARLPLHDHPQMTVLSQLLFGKLHVESYTWEDGSIDHMAATLDECGYVSGPAMLDLHAEERNIHDLEAISENGVAFFDVLCPPYGNGRDCTYYEVVQDLPSLYDVERVELEAVPCPPDFICLHSTYQGEKVDNEVVAGLAPA